MGVEARFDLMVYGIESHGGEDLAAHTLIEAAEEEAAHRCEICGGPGRLMSRGGSRGGWLKTVGPGCAQRQGYRPESRP